MPCSGDAGVRNLGRPGSLLSHPGRIVRRNLEALGVTQESLARHIGVTRQTISAIIAGRSNVTPDLAARLAKAFNTTAKFWSVMQSNHDVWDAERKPAIAKIRVLRTAARGVVVAPSNTKAKKSSGARA